MSTLKKWLEEKKPEKGDEFELTIDGEEYRAWYFNSNCYHFVLNCPFKTFLGLYPGGPEWSAITKARLLRPTQYKAAKQDYGLRWREYIDVGTWEKEKPETKLDHYETKHLERIESHLEKILMFMKELKAKQELRL